MTITSSTFSNLSGKMTRNYDNALVPPKNMSQDLLEAYVTS
ncbi:hypothetical protein [cyanobacterium endosymbiont of Rhopalodia gibberula]|nr:hypothetical protein [cyanobacterium endosymbiont of Rhopalodia gibberula]